MATTTINAKDLGKPESDEPKTRKTKTSTTDDRPSFSGELTAAERKIAEQLVPIYHMAGTGLSVVAFGANDKGLAGVSEGLKNLAENAAEEWVKLSRRNATVKTWINNVIEGVGIGGLIGVHVMILAPLLVNRGFLPGMIAPEYAPDPVTQPGV